MPSVPRLATSADLPLLQEIERAADRLFDDVISHAPWADAPAGELRASAPGFLLVVADSAGAPVGFAHVLEEDGVAHLEQLSVHPAHMRNGHGTALIDAALHESAQRGYAWLSVRTFADIPWNGPFYASRGFVETAPAAHPFFDRLLREEELQGLQRAGRRIQMIAPTSDARSTPLTLSPEEFEKLVVDELDQLPDDMVDGLDNVVFVVEDRPEDGSLDLLGLYDGLSLPERGSYGHGELPDRIIVYREPHLAQCTTQEELRDEIHTTLVHEIAHFYGFDDQQLHDLGWA